MTLIKSILAELISLFVDDGNLALQVVALVVLVTVITKLAGISALASAAVLVVGCVVILIASVLRKARSG